MEILQDFGVDWRLLIAQIINFAILLFLLRLLLYKPILKMLDERKKRIIESIEHAQEIEERMQKLEEETARLMSEARAQADAALKEANQIAKSQANELLTKTQVQAAVLVEKAREQNKAEFDQMRRELKQEVADVAVNAAQKAVSEILTDEQRKKLTQRAAREVVS